MFEDEAYISEALFLPSSESSRLKRPRVYEPLEGSSEGPTNPASEDSSSRGAMSRGFDSTPIGSASGGDDSLGSSSGGPDDAPIAEPGWLVE